MAVVVGARKESRSLSLIFIGEGNEGKGFLLCWYGDG